MRRFFLSLAIAVLLPLNAGAQQDGGLVARFSFSSSPGPVVYDETGTLYGLISGEAEVRPEAHFGGVLHIAGASGGFAIANHPLLDMEVGTIQVWLWVDNYHNADVIARATSSLLRTAPERSQEVYGIRLLSSGVISGIITNDDPHYRWSVHVTSKPGEMSLGAWHRLDLRWNGEKASFWLDGKWLDGRHYKPIPGLGLSYSNCSDLYVGQSLVWTGAGDFVGDIGRLTIFQRPLSDEEIEQGYQLERAALGM